VIGEINNSFSKAAYQQMSLLQNPHCVFNYSLREAKLESAGVPFLAR
jgi:hypothetical protein